MSFSHLQPEQDSREEYNSLQSRLDTATAHPPSNEWTEGWDAYFANKQKSSNPYGKITQPMKHLSWNRGWQAAHDKDD